jgi:hypothetical protein
MRKFFGIRRRLLATGLAGALILALAVVAGLWLAHSQMATASTSQPVSLVHVNPDGSDFTGNPLCSQTQWSGGKVLSVDPTHDCNNVTSQHHVIRTRGFARGMSPWPGACGPLNFDCFLLGAGPGQILNVDFCGNIPEVYNRANWNHDNDPQICVVIHSNNPGETSVAFSYKAGYDSFTTLAVIKEWRKLHDTVILKKGDLEDVTVGTATWKLPKDANGDGKRDAADEHLLNHDGENQSHSVILDETMSPKGLKSASGPIQLVEVVHGAEKAVDPQIHVAVEGAVVLAFIDPASGGCSFFTNPRVDKVVGLFTFTLPARTINYGTAVVGITNSAGQFVGPIPWPAGAQLSNEALAEAARHLLRAPVGNNNGASTNGDSPDSFFGPHLGVWVDTKCEGQTTITFKAGYPGQVGSEPQFPAPEQVKINWETLELSKQPQIRWAGEEIVLSTRWALPDEYFPNVNATTKMPEDICPLATGRPDYTGCYDPLSCSTAVTHDVKWVRGDPSPGALEGAYIDENGDGSLDALRGTSSDARGDIDYSCVSKGLAGSEVQGQMDIEAKLMESTWYCAPGYVAIDDDEDSVGKAICVDEDPWDGLDNDTGLCATDPETGADCTNTLDDDDDGYVNDGCPEMPADTGATAETECDNATDDETGQGATDPETGADCTNNDDDDNDDVVNDGCPKVGDGAVNDGCPAIGQVESGAACSNFLDDDNDGSINDGCPKVGDISESGLQCDPGNDTDDDPADTGGAGESGTQCANNDDDDHDGVVNDGCPTVGDGFVNDGCDTVGDGKIDEDPPNAIGIEYDPDDHKFTCKYWIIGWDPDFGLYGRDRVWVRDASLQSDVLLNKHAFMVWFLKIFEAKLTNVPGTWSEHNQGVFKTASGVDIEKNTGLLQAEELNVSTNATLHVRVKGWFRGANLSARPDTCVDMNGNGDGVDDDLDTLFNEDPKDGVDNDGDTKVDEDTQVPGEPYQAVTHTGCPDPADEMVPGGYWVLPDDFPTMAGPITGGSLVSNDVMSDITDLPSSLGIVGPKSTLDSDDTVGRPWIPCLPGVCPRKTVDPDKEITVADAIMPPLKIRVVIGGIDSVAGGDPKDAGFLIGVDKGDDLGLYQKIMIPADPEIPPFVHNGGYDWDSWLCRLEDANVASPYDTDSDGVSDYYDNCPQTYNPNQFDRDGDGQSGVQPTTTDTFGGDACDNDIDGDTVLNSNDRCQYDPTIGTTGGTDSDADTRPDSCDLAPADPTVKDQDADIDGVKDSTDNCPRDPNTGQGDFDKDRVGDVCDYDPFHAPLSQMIPCYTSGGLANLSGLGQGPYNFFDILNKPLSEVKDCSSTDATLKGELCNAKLGNQIDQSTTDADHPRIIEFYTDNRGWGLFAANGDYNLDFGLGSPDGCTAQQLSGTPDCQPGDVVGISNITVIGQYPYFRAAEKLRSIVSNPVEKTWTWGGFKTVTAERIDNTHTAIIAHLKDRDGYCKWSVDTDPTKKGSVIFSPSLNEVQHEWIEFRLNKVHTIRAISPNALYLGDVADQHSKIDLGMPLREVLKIKDHVSAPLAEERATGLEEGFAFDAERSALARAEDVRVLNYYGKGRGVETKYVDPTDPDECQAWIILEHPADDQPDVSVIFHDPEGEIDRHWPGSTYLSVLVQGWNDSCYTGPALDIEAALTDAGLIDADGTSHVLAAYRFTNDDTQSFDHWFPGRPDIEDTLTTIQPFDQLFLLLDSPMNWLMDVVADPTGQKDTQVSLIQNWNSVCYAGASKSPDQATTSINGSLQIIYTLVSDQTWRRYVPNRPELTNIATLNQYTSVFAFMTNAGTWVFDP